MEDRNKLLDQKSAYRELNWDRVASGMVRWVIMLNYRERLVSHLCGSLETACGGENLVQESDLCDLNSHPLSTRWTILSKGKNQKIKWTHMKLI